MEKYQKNEMMSHYEVKIKDIYLNRDISATTYINNFELYVQKWEKLVGSWTEEKKIYDNYRIGSHMKIMIQKSVSIMYNLMTQFIIPNTEHDLEKKAISEKRQQRFKDPDKERGRDYSDNHEKFGFHCK